MTETSIKNIQAIESLDKKVSELTNDKGLMAPYSASYIVNRSQPEIKSQNILIKDHKSIRMSDFLINTSIPITLCSKMLTFTDSSKSFELDEDL